MILYKGTSMYLNLALVYAYVVDCHGFKAPTNSEQIFRHAELVVTSTYLNKSLGLLKVLVSSTVLTSRKKGSRGLLKSSTLQSEWS